MGWCRRAAELGRTSGLGRPGPPGHRMGVCRLLSKTDQHLSDGLRKEPQLGDLPGAFPHSIGRPRKHCEPVPLRARVRTLNWSRVPAWIRLHALGQAVETPTSTTVDLLEPFDFDVRVSIDLVKRVLTPQESGTGKSQNVNAEEVSSSAYRPRGAGGRRRCFLERALGLVLSFASRLPSPSWSGL